MMILRRTIFFVIIAAGAALMVLLAVTKPRTPLDSTLAPAFQLLGVPAHMASRALTRVLPINALDEKELGDAIAERYSVMASKNEKDKKYLNEIMAALSKKTKKQFRYRAYPMEEYQPNAFALPGGVIFVTTGLLRTVKSEAELTSVIAHEIGHVELSHCMDTVRYELAARKIKRDQLGRIADFATRLLIGHSYSKTQEAQADEYGYEMILATRYNPSAVGRLFIRLKEYHAIPDRKKASPIKDYFMSHPHLSLRAEKYSVKASRWWAHSGGEKRYEGKKNLTARTSMFTRAYPDEWVTEAKK